MHYDISKLQIISASVFRNEDILGRFTLSESRLVLSDGVEEKNKESVLLWVAGVCSSCLRTHWTGHQVIEGPLRKTENNSDKHSQAIQSC